MPKFRREGDTVARKAGGVKGKGRGEGLGGEDLGFAMSV